METEFNFDELTFRQLIKIASAYNLKINGAQPNTSVPVEELRELVKSNLKILKDGSIVKNDETKSYNEVSLTGGAKVRMIII
jgi:hypothetical protein